MITRKRGYEVWSVSNAALARAEVTNHFYNQPGLESDTIQQCTVPPKPGSELPSIWSMGNSHSGHLQGMLYEVHDRLGVGVHLVAISVTRTTAQALREFHMKADIRIKRAYEHWSPDVGYRVLVDRICPRGLSRGKLHLDFWLKDVAPSIELQGWFGHEVSCQFSISSRLGEMSKQAPRQSWKKVLLWLQI